MLGRFFVVSYTLSAIMSSNMREQHGADWLRSRKKRAMDMTLAGVLAPTVLPVCLGAMPVIRCVDHMKPVIVQRRIGRGMQPFNMYKLRTMPESTPEQPSRNGWREEHATGLGRKLRMTHIDEMPQLINILQGNMSFVGFRPYIQAEIDLTKDVLDNAERKAWIGAIGVVQAGLFSDYMNQVHWQDYSEYSLRDRAIATVEFAETASFHGDLTLLADGLGIGVDGISRLVTQKATGLL